MITGRPTRRQEGGGMQGVRPAFESPLQLRIADTELLDRFLIEGNPCFATRRLGPRPVFNSSIWKNGPGPWEIRTFKGQFEVSISNGSGSSDLSI